MNPDGDIISIYNDEIIILSETTRAPKRLVRADIAARAVSPICGSEVEIELELEDGRRKTIHEGGVIIQRGTNHLWRNTSDQVCRIAFILIEAPPYLHQGVPLGEAKPEQVDPVYDRATTQS